MTEHRKVFGHVGFFFNGAGWLQRPRTNRLEARGGEVEPTAGTVVQVFLLAGSLSVIVGYKARVGASLLLTFLVLASYYFHPFWKLEGQAQQEQMIHFMKNLSMMGAMLFVVANGSGPMSLDSWLTKRSAPAEKPALFAQAG